MAAYNASHLVSLCPCSVTSSEKVDKAQRYADFTLLSVPYPGKDPFTRARCALSASNGIGVKLEAVHEQL